MEENNMPDGVEDPGGACEVLMSKVVTKEKDSVMFYKCVEFAIKWSSAAYNLLKEKIITEEDGKYFDDCVRSVKRRSNLFQKLVNDGFLFENENNDKTYKLSVVFSNKAFEELQELCKEESRSEVEVIRRALAKERWFLNNLKEGNKIVLEKRDGTCYDIISL